jgi:hydrogenase maturation factor HypF (carbamoyltransferase family)
MKIRITKLVGKSKLEFEIEQEDAKDAMFEAGVLASTPDICSECGSNEVELQGSKAKGYTFVKVVCKKCGSRADLGEYKEGGTFWKKFVKFETKYEGDSK